MTPTINVFNLPDRLHAKADPTLIADDERHFAAIAISLEEAITDVSARLSAERGRQGGGGQGAMDRDLEVHRLSARLQTLRRHTIDLCLGRMVGTDYSKPIYIGRIGLTDDRGRRLLVDWRAPAAEPFFAATQANPMGLKSRRRYRWTRGQINDYWDEMFDGVDGDGGVALDDESAFLASLGSSRSPRMRDVLSTIQADQDAIIRATSRGALVVDGGPGTGKTVVALHRAAYLLYSDPRLTEGRGGVLFIGPHDAYLNYVEDILPSLGEEGVQICTLRDLVPEGSTEHFESDPLVYSLKASGRLVTAIERAVRIYEVPPSREQLIETPWGDVEIGESEWREAFDAADSGTPHNEARDQVWEALLDIIIDSFDADEVPPALLRRALVRNDDLTSAFARAWSILDPAHVVADLWSVPEYLQGCAPWLSPTEVRALQRLERCRWTVSDLPFLDAARLRIGDPHVSRTRRLRERMAQSERVEMDRVVDDLIAADDDGEGLLTMLRGEDVQRSLSNESALPVLHRDRLAGPFAHVIVDEAQELTDAEWQMLLTRCPSRSFTIVGDRAQARHGFSESWEHRLGRLGMSRIQVASLTINYRTPEEIMVEAEPTIRAVLPDANVPTSVRRSGIAVRFGRRSDLTSIVDSWLDGHPNGLGCVIGEPAFPSGPRIRSMSPAKVKGLEFDLVVLVEPESFGTGIEGAVDRYVAMTRATSELVVLSGADAPS